MTLIRDIMERNVITISEDSSVRDAACLLRDRDISFTVTVSGDRPTGIVTERDITRKVVADTKLTSESPVSEIRSSFLSIDPSTSIEVAVQKMMNTRVRRLVVLDGEDLVGVVTQTDLTTFLRNKILIDGTLSKSG